MTSCIFLAISLVLATALGKKFCVTSPELYYANVAGRIDGGYDDISLIDQTPCSQKTNLDRTYRQIDGKCNHPMDYGSALQPNKRYLQPHYMDDKGINTPRIYSVVGGTYLPSPRLLSWKLFPDVKVVTNTSLWTMQFGQFVNHDITSVPVPTGTNGTIKCCGVAADKMPEECFPIPIPKDDPRFQDCMEFVRSEAAKDEKGNQIYPREQLNSLTSFIDGSNIYGSDLNTSRSLRTENGKGALLRTQLVGGKERLPNDTSARPGCLKSKQPGSYCQVSGDRRVNLQPGLGVNHLLFHLFHNRIVRRLAEAYMRKAGQPINPHAIEQYIFNAPDYLKEKLFQEARKIVGAVIQKITYCEWLPVILGPELMDKYKLGCARRSKYNPYVDPRISNSFSAAAFRFGHTLVPDALNIDEKPEFLKDTFLIPDSSFNKFEKIVKTLLVDGDEYTFDWFFSDSISKHLFEPRTGAKGALDLLSVNIQRGRDHGVPAYYYWRQFCGLRRFTRFEDFGEMGQQMKQLYRHIMDVDLFVGGVMEPRVYGGVIGETMGCIVARQFSELKFGDAHFFLSKEYPQGFTDSQVEAIKKVELNSLLCLIGNAGEVQANPYYLKSETNPMTPCSYYQDIDLTPWTNAY